MQKKAKVDAKNTLENVLYQAKTQFGEKIPTLGKFCDAELLWLENNPDASVEEYQTKIKTVQEWITAEVQKNGGNPQAGPSASSSTDKSNKQDNDLPDIDEIVINNTNLGRKSIHLP